MVRMQGPANCGGFGYGGIAYKPDEDGIIEVPHEAIEAAKSHGFSVAVEKQIKKPLAKGVKAGAE